MLNPKENALEVLNWGHPEYVPLTSVCNPMMISLAVMTEEPFFGGKDCYGVNWELNSSGAIPAHDRPIYESITDWESFLHLPDPDSFDFKAAAEFDLRGVDRDKQLVNIMYPCGLFERMVTFLGFENTLCDLVMEPEASKDYMYEVGKFKAAVIERAIDAYKPDMVTYADDMATARAPFMSMDVYREVIKPAHRLIADAITGKDVIFCQHICGKAEDFMPDLIDMGCKMWSSAQTMNDIKAVQEKYRGKLVIEGGWDTAGRPGQVDSSIEECMEEALRCIREYGPGMGYFCWPVIMGASGDTFQLDPRLTKIIEEWDSISHIYG